MNEPVPDDEHDDDRVRDEQRERARGADHDPDEPPLPEPSLGLHAATGTLPPEQVGLRRRIWEILDVGRPGDKASLVFDAFIQSLIAANVVALVLSTMDEFEAEWGRQLLRFEDVSVLIFTIEYLGRLVTCTTDARFAKLVHGRIAYARTPMALVDLFAILPWYLPMVGIDLRFMRALRLFRLLKLSRYSKPLGMFRRVVRKKRDQLVATLFLIGMALLFASSLMYYAEHDSQPEVFSSIPKSMWWGMVTLSTVGYGDMFPVTPMGRALGACIAMLGVLMFALPTAILGSAFMEEFETQRSARTCPHCGERLDE